MMRGSARVPVSIKVRRGRSRSRVLFAGRVWRAKTPRPWVRVGEMVRRVPRVSGSRRGGWLGIGGDIPSIVFVKAG